MITDFSTTGSAGLKRGNNGRNTYIMIGTMITFCKPVPPQSNGKKK
jgi:hypothetical protein